MELSTTANSLPPVPKRGIELAFQLQAFRSGNPNCSSVAEFDGATLHSIEFIYIHYLVPPLKGPYLHTRVFP